MEARAGVAITFASTNCNEPKFLAPAADSPQLKGEGQLQNEKPWIGAVGP